MADDLRKRVIHYEHLLSAMQSCVFFVQDAEGVLRRWTPPVPLPSEDTASPGGSK